MAFSTVLLGAIGFATGFFGPIVLNPEANQGPLLGIFFTGPVWTVIGIVFGLLAAAMNLRPRSFLTTLATLAVVAGVSTLYLSLPDDRYQGFIIDGEILDCSLPTEIVTGASARWEMAERNKTWQEFRPGWQEDIAHMLEVDPGVVLAVKVHGRREVFEKRKPWNSGTLRATRWESPQTVERYFARYEGSTCSSYRRGSRDLYFPVWEASRVSPPDRLPTYLGFFVLETVPLQFLSIVEN